VLIADYWVLRRARLDLAGLYRKNGPYWYAGGFNPIALIALVAGIAPCLPGFATAVAPEWIAVHEFWSSLYVYAWFVSFGVSFVSYVVLMRLWGPRFEASRAP
jgi:NCS1 family nucleobase:cation symporter-1